jgi:hypothetical protein
MAAERAEIDLPGNPDRRDAAVMRRHHVGDLPDPLRAPQPGHSDHHQRPERMNAIGPVVTRDGRRLGRFRDDDSSSSRC